MSDTKVDENVSKHSDLEKTYQLVRKRDIWKVCDETRNMKQFM